MLSPAVLGYVHVPPQHNEDKINDWQHPKPRQRDCAQNDGGVRQRAVKMKQGEIDAENGEQPFGCEETQKQCRGAQVADGHKRDGDQEPVDPGLVRLVDAIARRGLPRGQRRYVSVVPNVGVRAQGRAKANGAMAANSDGASTVYRWRRGSAAGWPCAQPRSLH